MDPQFPAPPVQFLPLGRSQIRIYAADGEWVAGSGFLLREREVLTCVHVVTRALGLPDDVPEPPSSRVSLDFPFLAPGQCLAARVVLWHPQDDIAVLELEAGPPAGAAPAPLMKGGDLWGHHFRAFGFPEGYPEGVWAGGVVRGPNACGRLQIEDTKQTGYRVQQGFSGAPVWDEDLGGVVGMVSAAEGNPSVRAASIIPTERLTAVLNVHPEAKPVLSNPFIPLSGRIHDPDQVFDREREVDEALDLLHSGGGAALIGPAGVGKSSLLTRLLALATQRLGPLWKPVYLNLQPIASEDEFYEEICRALGVPTCRGIRLQRVLERQPQRTLLCLDEVEKMSWEGFDRGLRAELRGFADMGLLKLVLVARSPLDRLFPDSEGMTSPLANLCHEVRVEEWDEGTARAFLRQRLSGSGVQFTEEEIAQLIAANGGHPQQLMCAAHRLFNEKVK
ncbi:MAG: trypsin-like peptidase domain-containing protein [Clostridia bacterium]|nr:trypsin-like peptidase domain-containing protein [Clostridia bacterium]